MIVPTIGNVQWDTNKLEWLIRGKRVQQLIGRSWFKGAILLSYHFSGQGGEIPQFSAWPGDAKSLFYEGIAHNQRIFNTKDVVLRMFLETGAWNHVAPGIGMFGSPPQDQRFKNNNLIGMWNIAQLRALAQAGDRVQNISNLMKNTLDEIFKASHDTGCIFELVIDATLKHTDGMTTGVIDHVIRQMATEMRSLQIKYANAAIIVSARNEWDAHNETNTTLDQVNRWAERFYRWKRQLPSGEFTTRFPNGNPAVSYTKPAAPTDGGGDWMPEQWPEGFLIVDHGGNDKFHYDVGPEAGKYKMGAIHPGRIDHNAQEGWNPKNWWEIPSQMWNWLWANSRGMPVGFTESMFGVSKQGTLDQYKTVSGRVKIFNKDQIDLMLQFITNIFKSTNKKQRVAYHIVHDDIGAQADSTYNLNSAWEMRLAKYFEGTVDPPPIDPPPIPPIDPPPIPPVDPPAWPPEDQSLRPYDKWVVLAYKEILGREEPDLDGRKSWNTVLETSYNSTNFIASVISMQESMRNSVEFKNKNDGPWNYAEVPPVDPEPPPVDPSKPETLYIQWEQREEWARNLEFAYSVWRGDRDLSVLLGQGSKYLADGSDAILDINLTQLQDLISWLVDINARGTTLQYRIVTEKHRTYPNRSQVRKSVANDMKAELEAATAAYTRIGDQFPLIQGCDSIRCKVEKMNM